MIYTCKMQTKNALTVLPGCVKHEYVHHVIQIALYARAVAAGRLVGAFDAARVPVRPVDVVHVLCQPERMRHVLRDHGPDVTSEHVRSLDLVSVDIRPVELSVGEVDRQPVDATRLRHQVAPVGAIEQRSLDLVVGAPVDPVHEPGTQRGIGR